MKTCYRCLKELPSSEFSNNRSNKDGLQSDCRTCRLDKKIQDLYGITLADRNTMYVNQGGKCKVCEKPIEFKKYTTGACIDHCHETGLVRGILCYNCNLALGHAKDSIKILEALIGYIRK